MKLYDFIASLTQSAPATLEDREISGVTADSRLVRPGMIFVAVSGGQADGHEFIDAAFKTGAVCVIGQKPHSDPRYIQVPDSREALAVLAAKYYSNPSHRMLMLAVTGTSGKTTTTYLLESILRASGHRVGVIGTVNFRYGDRILPSTHTTPGPVELQQLLSEMRDGGCTAVIMEVSSHALKQKRIAGIAFDGMIFTNLSREHLDFHPSMEDYFASKALLFTEYVEVARRAGKLAALAINRDNGFGDELYKRVSGASRQAKAVTGFSLKDITSMQTGLEGLRGSYRGLELSSPLMGGFNASNVLGAVALTQDLGIPAAAIQQGIAELRCVPGRMEPVPQAQAHGLTILVDYAHKPDALEKVLVTLRTLLPRGQGQLITVFGCGGDRDRTKRPVMGEIATRLSDFTIVTSDNPRTEDPGAIIQEILGGIREGKHEVQPDRRQAIYRAVELAQKGDLVLIAGKGHEDYQILGQQKIHFNDKEIALEALTRVFENL